MAPGHCRAGETTPPPPAAGHDVQSGVVALLDALTEGEGWQSSSASSGLENRRAAAGRNDSGISTPREPVPNAPPLSLAEGERGGPSRCASFLPPRGGRKRRSGGWTSRGARREGCRTEEPARRAQLSRWKSSCPRKYTDHSGGLSACLIQWAVSLALTRKKYCQNVLDSSRAVSPNRLTGVSCSPEAERGRRASSSGRLASLSLWT